MAKSCTGVSDIETIINQMHLCDKPTLQVSTNQSVFLTHESGIWSGS